MRILIFILVSGLFCTSLATVRITSSTMDDEGYMNDEDRAKAIKLLRNSENEFFDLVNNLTDEQWNYKPGMARWSIGEVAQHIVLTEAALFANMERALASPVNPEWKAKTAGKDEFLLRVLVSRDRRAQAPESIRPVQKISRADVMSRYKETRAKTLKFIEETKQPMKSHTFDHPFPAFSTLNAYQWFIYIPLHNLRHNQQIAEVKASSGFPK